MGVLNAGIYDAGSKGEEERMHVINEGYIYNINYIKLGHLCV